MNDDNPESQCQYALTHSLSLTHSPIQHAAGDDLSEGHPSQRAPKLSLLEEVALLESPAKEVLSRYGDSLEFC